MLPVFEQICPLLKAQLMLEGQKVSGKKCTC